MNSHSFLMAGERVEHPDAITAAVGRGLASGGPYIVEVMTEGGVPPQ